MAQTCGVSPPFCFSLPRGAAGRTFVIVVHIGVQDQVYATEGPSEQYKRPGEQTKGMRANKKENEANLKSRGMWLIYR